MSFSLKDIEGNLSAEMVRKGLDYFSAGRVDQLSRQENGWSAIVHGTSDYTVIIHLQGGHITNWQCNCPYDQGPACKHVAAVLFAIRTEWAEAELAKMRAFAKRNSKKP